MSNETIASGIILLDQIPFAPDAAAVMKSMRVRKTTASLEAMVKELVEQAKAIARPRVVYRVSQVKHIDTEHVTLDGVQFKSNVLSKCLQTVNRAFPCICTCGREIDEWKAPADDVMASFCAETIKTFAVGAAIVFIGKYLEQTYSTGRLTHMNPGEFEDWPITQQKPLFSLFGDTEKLIGVTLTSGSMMKPVKSRSGIYFANEEGFESCQFCPMAKCPGRRARYQPEKLKDYGVEERKSQ